MMSSSSNLWKAFWNPGLSLSFKLTSFFEVTKKALKISIALTQVNYPFRMIDHSALLKNIFPVERLAILCITILLSFVSLAKTGYAVNVPDPDERRKARQVVSENSHFWITSIPFHFICVLFRVLSLAYFCANLSNWTFLIVFGTFAVNFAILHFAAESGIVISVLLSLVSVFVPNGYLLYNFAATFLVDMTYDQSKKFLALHMMLVTAIFSSIIAIIWAGQVEQWTFVSENIPTNSVLSQDIVKHGMNSVLLFLAGMSVALAYVHWMKSIKPLYKENGEAIELQEQLNV